MPLSCISNDGCNANCVSQTEATQSLASHTYWKMVFELCPAVFVRASVSGGSGPVFSSVCVRFGLA